MKYSTPPGLWKYDSATQISPRNAVVQTVKLTSPATTANAIDVVASALTTGSGLKVYSNSTDGGSRYLAHIHNDHTSASGTIALVIDQDADQDALLIDNSGNGRAAQFASAASTSNIVDVYAGSLTTGKALYIAPVSTNNVITSGEFLNVSLVSNGASLAAKSGQLVSFTSTRTETRTSGTTTEDFHLVSIVRTSVMNGVGGTLAEMGTVVRIANTATQTNGTLTDAVAVLGVTQSINSTGSVIKTTNPGAGADLQLTNSQAGAIGVHIIYQHTSASPAANDRITQIDFQGTSSLAVNRDYARLDVLATTVTDGSEEGALVVSTQVAGVLSEVMRFAQTTVFNESSANNHDLRMEGATDANLFFLDGSADFIGLGTNAPLTKLHVVGAVTQTGSVNNRATSNKILYGATTDAATAVELTTDGAAGSGATNRIAVPTDTALSVVVNICVKQSGSANAKQMLRQFLISNNGGTTAIQGTVTTLGTDVGSVALATVTTTITANDTNDCIKIEVNGVAATNLRYTAYVVSTETLYA